MILKSMRSHIATCALSLAALSCGSTLQAAEKTKPVPVQQFVNPAQAFYQSTTAFTPGINQQIAFKTKNFKTNVDVNKHKTVFEVKLPGLYQITAFMLVNVPNLGDSVTGSILINKKSYLNFINEETAVNSTTIPLLIEREIYLSKGDKVSVVLQSAPTGTTIGNRGFRLINWNNTQ